MTILADIGTKVGGEIKNLDIRMSAAETAIVNLGGQVPPPTGSFTIEPVTWTNLSEINLSGEKLVNGDFTQSGYVQKPSFALPTSPDNPNNNNYTFAVADRPLVIALQTTDGMTQGEIYRIHTLNVATVNARIYALDGTQIGWVLGRGTKWEVVENELSNWTVVNGTLNESKLAEGIIKGSGGQVAIQQTFSQNIAQGTDLVIKVTGDDDIRFYPIKSNGQTDTNNDFTVLASNGYAEHTTQTAVSGFKISTVNGMRELSSVSIFQGEVSGGSVQTFTGGSIEKISGAGSYNAGASSVQKIDGQKDGYVQFQIGHATHSLKIGLVNQDHDFEVDAPWKMNFGGGYIDLSSPWIADHTSFVAGDWFRIRHYSQSNEVHFQKRQTVYADDYDFCLNQACGLNPTGSSSTDHAFAEADRPLVQAKQSANGMTAGEYYRIHKAKVTDNEGKERGQVYTLDGTLVAWIARRDGNNASKWEVQEELGEDYVTFYTHPVLSNGGDLYIDTVFHAVGARLNDVQIAYK